MGTICVSKVAPIVSGAMESATPGSSACERERKIRRLLCEAGPIAIWWLHEDFVKLGGFGVMKIRIRHVAVFAHIETFLLFLGRHAQTDSRIFDHRPENQRQREHERADGGDADDLRRELRHAAAHEQTRLGDRGRRADARIGEQADREGAEDAVDHVDRNGADGIVNLDAIEEQHGADNEHARNDADRGMRCRR